MLPIPKDVWRMIAIDLSTWDLLHLRATCKDINNKIKKMHKKWYQSYQFLLIQNKLMNRVDCISKRHPGRLSVNCGIYWMEKTKGKGIGGVRKMIADGIITKRDCQKSVCWTYRHNKFPNNKSQIPINHKDFKPKVHNYIYMFLIESYRIRHAKHLKFGQFNRREIIKFDENITQKKQMIKQLQFEIKRLEDKKDRAKNKRAAIQKMLQKNEIFKNKKIKTYKGP